MTEAHWNNARLQDYCCYSVCDMTTVHTVVTKHCV